MAGKTRANVDYQQREEIRYTAAEMFVEDISQADIARELDVSRQSVSRWHKAFKKYGKAGLASTGQRGRPSKLSIEQKEKLQSILEKGAKRYGYSIDLWTLPRIADVIWKEFKVSYNVAHIWWIMSSLGWSCQKPTKRAIERDEGKIEDWKQHEWIYIKKKPKKQAKQ